MDNFWFDVLQAALVTTITILSDWFIGQFITESKTLAAIKRTADRNPSDPLALNEIKEQLLKLQGRRASALSWGADLVAVSISLDIAALGIWISDKTKFQFFNNWNSVSSNKEIEIWSFLLLAHFILLFLSIVFKHLHSEKIESIQPTNLVKIFHREWISQNFWMVICNALGFITLLSSFSILTFKSQGPVMELM